MLQSTYKSGVGVPREAGSGITTGLNKYKIVLVNLIVDSYSVCSR